MIRNAMFGLSLLALSAGSALAAPAKHVSKPRVVAEATAPAGRLGRRSDDWLVDGSAGVTPLAAAESG